MHHLAFFQSYYNIKQCFFVIFWLKYLFNKHPEFLVNRYNIELVDELNEDNEIVLLERIGQKRGLLRAKGEVEISKVEELILKEFKEGIMGRYSLESVEEIYG